MRRLEYPKFLLDLCVLEEDRQSLISGVKKTGDTILVNCEECGFEYYIRIHDIYRHKVNPNGLLKPIICSHCVHKNNPSGIVKKQMELKGDKNGRGN